MSGTTAKNATDQPHGDNEDAEEGDVDQGRKRVGGEEIAHEFEVAQLVRELARASRPLLQVDAQNVREDAIGKLDIREAARTAHERRAQRAEQEVEQEGRADADDEHPKRGQRLVGKDAIVDVHHEDRDASASTFTSAAAMTTCT